MSFEGRGGFPTIRRLAAPVAGLVQRPRSIIKYLQLSNVGASDCRLYFDRALFDANGTEGYFELPAGTGVFEGPVEQDEYYLRGVGGVATIAAVEYSRRG